MIQLLCALLPYSGLFFQTHQKHCPEEILITTNINIDGSQC